MFAVVRTGGKQYRVAPGDKIVVDRLDGEAGDTITLGDGLLAGEGSDLKSTDGLKVAAEIIAQAKGEKVTVFKKKRRHNYRRKRGHRQQHTILRITAIGDKKAPKEAQPKQETAKSEAAVKSAPAKAPSKAEAAASAAAGESVDTKKSEKPKTDKPKAEKKAAPAKAKKAPAKASTKNAAPAKGAAKKATKAKK